MNVILRINNDTIQIILTLHDTEIFIGDNVARGGGLVGLAEYRYTSNSRLSPALLTCLDW